MSEFPNEEILADDYPVYWGYAYVADGKVVCSNIKGTVGQMKRTEGYAEGRRCNLSARQKAFQTADPRP